MNCYTAICFWQLTSDLNLIACWYVQEIWKSNQNWKWI